MITFDVSQHFHPTDSSLFLVQQQIASIWQNEAHLLHYDLSLPIWQHRNQLWVFKFTLLFCIIFDFLQSTY